MSLDDLQRQQQESKAVEQICERLNELVRTFRRDGGPKILELASSDPSLKGLMVSTEIYTITQVEGAVWDRYWSEMALVNGHRVGLIRWAGSPGSYGTLRATGTTAQAPIMFFEPCYIWGDRLEWGPYMMAIVYGSAQSLSLPIHVGSNGFFWRGPEDSMKIAKAMAAHLIGKPVLRDFDITPSQIPSQSRCFIASSVYGESTPQVIVLRDFRDLVLHFRNEKQVNFLFPRLFTECQL